MYYSRCTYLHAHQSTKYFLSLSRGYASEQIFPWNVSILQETDTHFFMSPSPGFHKIYSMRISLKQSDSSNQYFKLWLQYVHVRNALYQVKLTPEK